MRIQIIIDDASLTDDQIVALLQVPKQLHHINNRLGFVLEKEDKIMADLSTEFAALGDAISAQLKEIDTEIKQVSDAIAAGQDAAAVVENARGRITAVTAQINQSIEALKADNPPAP